MLLKQMMELFDILDSPTASGANVRIYLYSIYPRASISVQTIKVATGSSDVIIVTVPGTEGKISGGTAPTTGIIGQLGSLGARPDLVGFISDGDGAICSLTVAAKLLDMLNKGDQFKGDVIIATSIAPYASLATPPPYPTITIPVPIHDLNEVEVKKDMDVIFSVDATKGNNIINQRGFAISPVMIQGYILPVTPDLLTLAATVSGKAPYVFPLSIYDVTPYESGYTHINSIMSPNIFTSSPVIGVAITTQTVVPGSSLGANHFEDLENAARFLLEAANAFGSNLLNIYDAAMLARAQGQYGPLTQFQH
jgi:hypothetical protein